MKPRSFRDPDGGDSRGRTSLPSSSQGKLIFLVAKYFARWSAGGAALRLPPPARVDLHGLPELSRALGSRSKPDLHLKLVLGKSPLADLDTALSGPDDDHLLAATIEGLLLPLPCPFERYRA